MKIHAKEHLKALRNFYHGSTLLKQFTEDDSLRLKEDMKKKGLPSPDRADGLCIVNFLNKHFARPRVLEEKQTKEEKEFYENKKPSRTVQSIINRLYEYLTRKQ